MVAQGASISANMQQKVRHTNPKPAGSSTAPSKPPKLTAAQKGNTPQSRFARWGLNKQQQLQFERQGYLVTPQLLQEHQVQQVYSCVQQVVQKQRLQALKHRVRVLCPDFKGLTSLQTAEQALQVIQQQGNSELGFLQFFNLHRSHTVVADLVQDSQLPKIAAQLLGVRRLRLYQDCVFLKDSGFAETNWHSDLRMAPLDTNSFVTAWIPLRPITGGEQDSGLVFAVGSHRDFALPFWHDLKGRDLQDRAYELADTGPMALGDVSWHHGWTLHGAAAQPAGSPQRLALTVSFFADGARLLARKSDPSVHKHMLHDEDAESYSCWLRDMKDGAVARHKMLPVVYST